MAELNLLFRDLNGEIVTSQFKHSSNINSIKQYLNNELNISDIDYSLSYNGTYLNNDFNINDYHINNNSVIDINIPCLGGARPAGSKKKLHNLTNNIVVNPFIVFDDNIHCENWFEDNKDNILEMKTIRSTAFKTLFDSIQNILTDVNLTFDKTGMKMLAKNGSGDAIVHLKLNAEEFEHYYCEIRNNKPIIVGINVLSIFKIIKTVDNNDTISFFIQKNDPNILHIKYENDNNTIISFKYKMLDIQYEKFSIPNKEFNSVITLPSSDLQKYMRDMNNLNSTTIDFKTINDTVQISCDGDNQQQITIKSNSNVKFAKQTDTIIQGAFSLKYLLLFIKATNLCPTVNIYIENEYPLILEYSVASIGHIRFILLPKSG